EDEPLHPPQPTAPRPGRGRAEVLRADRAARMLAEAGAGALAASGQLQAGRRAACGSARPAAARPPLLRVPARELVRAGGVRAAAIGGGGAGGWRRTRAARPGVT